MSLSLQLCMYIQLNEASLIYENSINTWTNDMNTARGHIVISFCKDVLLSLSLIE